MNLKRRPKGCSEVIAVTTENISSPKVMSKLLRDENIRLAKSLGQNFLSDSNIIRKIVDAAEISEEDNVVEIGPGIGVLTAEIAKRAGNVIAFEIDTRLIRVLNKTLAGFENVTVFNEDASKVDWPAVVQRFPPQVQGKRIKVVANLPYYITTPLVTAIMGSALPWDTLVFMVQKEVAERMAAPAGSKTYGSLSVFCGFHSETKIAFIVPPTVFIPQPKVHSAVVVMKRRERDVPFENKFFESMVGSAFQQRRKKIVNSMRGFAGISNAILEQAMLDSGIDPGCRAETVSTDRFIGLAEKLHASID